MPKTQRFPEGMVLHITGDVSSLDVLDRDILDVEADVVSRNGSEKSSVMHFDGLDFVGDASWGEGDVHAGFQDAGLNTSDRNGPNTGNLIHILKGNAEGFVGGSFGLEDLIKGL